MSTRTTSAVTDRERRGPASLGGLIPSAEVAREGDTLVTALCAEVHAEGAVLPLLVLSDAPGLLGWEPSEGLAVHDDAGRPYRVESLAQQAGLGALQTAVWISPAPPPDARRLTLEVSRLTRTAVTRSGGGVERPLAGATWTIGIDLVPPRTTAEVPPEPAGAPPDERPARVPVRTFGGFGSLVPIGQARMAEGLAVCLWALERYQDRAVLSLGILAEEPLRAEPLAPGEGRVEVWDDRGARYATAPVHGAGHGPWSESSLEIAPAIDARARALAVRLSELPVGAPAAGSFTFGLSLPGDG